MALDKLAYQSGPQQWEIYLARGDGSRHALDAEQRRDERHRWRWGANSRFRLQTRRQFEIYTMRADGSQELDSLPAAIRHVALPVT
jgi:hypothetical protein